MSWSKIKLGEVLNHRKGSIIIDDDSEYKLCRVQLHRRGVVLRDVVKGATIKTKKQQVCKSGDFLVAEMDAKLGGYGFVPEELDGAIVSSHYFLFELDKTKIRPDFLEVVSQLQILQDQIKAVGSTNYSAIRPRNVLEWEIPITNLEDQRSIEVLFRESKSKSEDLSTELTLQLDLVKQLRQAFLREAMQGQLVPQDPTDEPASVLLKKIKAEKERLIKEKKIKKQKPLPPITEEEIPFEIPENWVWCKIDSLVFDLNRDLRTGPFGTALNKSEHKQDGVPVWGIESISKSGQFTNLNKIFVDEVKAHELRSFEVLGGDLIISRSGTIAELCMIPLETKKGLLSTNLMKISLNHSVMMPEIFCHIIKGSVYIKESLKEMCSGSTRLFLTQKILKELVFPLPPLPEQKRIVAKLDELMHYCDELEASIKASQQQNELLLQQVLREALEPQG